MTELKTLTGAFDLKVAVKNACDQLAVTGEGIAEMQAEYMPLVVAGVDDKEGMATVVAARKTVGKLRIAVDKKRKELKEDSNAYGKAVQAAANEIFEKIAPVETHLIEQEKSVQKELDRLKAEAEAARDQEIVGWVDRLNESKLPVHPNQIDVMDAAEFEEHFAKLMADQAKEAAEAEAEKVRLAEERAELAKQRAKLEADQAAERERVAAETAAADLIREQERAELYRKNEEAERVRNEEREKQQAELDALRAKEAERNAADEAARLEAEAKEAELARVKREAELLPVRQKLDQLAKVLDDIVVPGDLGEVGEKVRPILQQAACSIRDLGR